MSEKTKRQHTLPNRQLAKAFAFSADDLAANRLGFISRAQAMSLPLWARANFNGVLEHSFLRRLLPTLKKLGKACGKISLEVPLHDVHGGRFQIASHVLSLKEANLRFRLTQAQYQVLKNGMSYQIYYEEEPLQILSLESINHCNDKPDHY